MSFIQERVLATASLMIRSPRLFFIRALTRLRPGSNKVKRKFGRGATFEFDFDYDPLIKTMYFGYYEKRTVVAAMERLLEDGDTFIDVGANIGYLSAIALGLVGTSGQVHSFEPVPRHFDKLAGMAALNSEYSITVNQCALGDCEGRAEISLTILPNVGWNTMVPGFMNEDTVAESIEVPVRTLDSYVREKALDRVNLIKIDTEGYEFLVLKGLRDYLGNVDYRPLIICEVAPKAYPLLGYEICDLQEYMAHFDYHAVSLDEYSIEVDITSIEKTTDVLFAPHSMPL